ncbi:MAG: ATP-binding protein [Proteobacteria bacterium]|nr:ATP-binding protein [Pseudomonadota bacterium]
MNNDFTEKDYEEINALMRYPEFLDKHLNYFEDTSEIAIPRDPIDKVIFQNEAKSAIRKIAQNKGHILMVGRPGTGKSLLANMFKEVIDVSLGDYIRPKDAIAAYPGKDDNHVRFAYGDPDIIEKQIEKISEDIDKARNSVEPFSLRDQIRGVNRVKNLLFLITLASIGLGLFYSQAFILTGLAGIGTIFMYMQVNNHKVQEKIQQDNQAGRRNEVKFLQDMIPEMLYDPRKDQDLMISISEPDARNMKGGFRHDPYQSGNLQTPIHKRTYLGAHAKAPIIYIDELKTLVRSGYMSSLLEIMQNKEYILEGGKNTGSGAADRAENPLSANNIIIACCNHDTLSFLQSEGDGAFLSRIEDKGEIIQMESSVTETPETLFQVAQFIKQEVNNLGNDFRSTWGEIIEAEGHAGVRRRSEKIFGKALPMGYTLKEREFARDAVTEIIKELRCRASDGKLSALLRPINGIIKTAEHEAILENSDLVRSRHVKKALTEHLSLEGSLSREATRHKKELKNYISSMTDSIGYVVGLAVISSQASGQMFGQPLPIHCQINSGGADSVAASGKTGDIAKAAAQNVRASIKKTFRKIGAPYIGYEMHIEYIQAHGGVEGDSASIAIDVALISDYIKMPVNQQFGITGSLTGDIILAVGGVTEKVRSIMDPDLNMLGACIPWQNKDDIEPLLVNVESEFILNGDIPGIRIFRGDNSQNPFDIYFIKTKYNAYRILMGIDRNEFEEKMARRSRMDFDFMKSMKSGAEQACPTNEQSREGEPALS